MKTRKFTPEEIQQMAREAGFYTGFMAMQTGDGLIPFALPIGDRSCLVELERFATIVTKRIWQPIETAPKDSTRILLLIDHGEYGDKVWTGLWADGWIVSYGKATSEPTHWMPLPDASDAAIIARSAP